jgi:hypothetical protein
MHLCVSVVAVFPGFIPVAIRIVGIEALRIDWDCVFVFGVGALMAGDKE